MIFWGMTHPLNPEYPYKDYFVSYIDYYKPGGVKKQLRMAVNMLYSSEAKRNIEKLIQTEKPDIVHLNNFAHQISPSILHVFKKYNIPAVMTMRDYKLICPTYTMVLHGKLCERCKNGRYYHCLINRCSKNSFLKSLLNTMEMYLHHDIMHIYDLIDVYISPSKFLKSKCEEMGFHGKIVYLPNFVKIEDYDTEYNSQESSIVYFGRLSEEKGLFTLIEAIKDIPGVTLKIIGEGPLRNSLEFRAKSLELKNVKFLGYKTGQELKDEVKKSMFVVVPSEWYENNPRSVIEGFAMGKPVIGARIGGIPELVQDNETGLLFEPGSPYELCSKIEYLVNNPGKIIEMGRNARLFVEKELQAERHYRELMNIYNQALNMEKEYENHSET